MKALNALILSSVISFGAASAFAGGHAERCMQAMNILTEAQVDPVMLDMIMMRSDPMPELANTMFAGDFGAAENFLDQLDALGPDADAGPLFDDAGIDSAMFDEVMMASDPMDEIADTFFGGDVAGAENVMMALEATETDPEMCAEFMMPSDAGAMQEGMALPPECMPAFDLAMQNNVDPMMMMMIDERVGDDETAFLEEVAFTFFQEDTEAAGMFLNEMDDIAQANDLSWEMCMPPMSTNN